MITQEEFNLILQRCRNLSPAKGMYLENDYMTNLFLTVLDFQLKSEIVKKAIGYYKDKRFDEIRTFNNLKNILSKYKNNKEENTFVSQYLWGYKYWNRVSLLRKLLIYFESVDVKSQEALNEWAKKSDFKKDFKGKISGMGYAIYKWLVMRQGIETVKPDLHLRRFVKSIIQHDFTDYDLVVTLEEVAKQLCIKAYELDWRIWEHQRNIK